ncbi:MAG: tripartite tricarboxylate transporter TctB family protein [Eubacteriales bacterium]|nr:tripartite tricarboxylate transporter TctB family protein [Eubacteriales bacterium]
MKKVNGNAIVGALLALAACLALYVTNTTLKSNSSLGDPGPKFFPNLICAAILVLAIIIIIQSIRQPKYPFEGTLAMSEKKEGCMKMLMILADLLLFLILWKHIPFLAAGFIFIFIQCMIFKEKLLFSILYSAGVTGVLYLAFSVALKVNLNIY